jgi:hypothetical protein
MAAVKIETEFRYLLRDRDRLGNPRVYYRPPGGKMIRLRATIGTEEFVDECRRARDGVPPVSSKSASAVPAAKDSLTGVRRSDVVKLGRHMERDVDRAHKINCAAPAILAD